MNEDKIDAILARQLGNSIARNGRLVMLLLDVINCLEENGHPVEAQHFRAQLVADRAQLVADTNGN
jgi:hypothetical protein